MYSIKELMETEASYLAQLKDLKMKKRQAEYDLESLTADIKETEEYWLNARKKLAANLVLGD